MNQQMQIGALTVAVTTEEIRTAPPEVRRWLYELIGAEVSPAGLEAPRPAAEAAD